MVANADQADTDSDDAGNACDTDDDDDTILDDDDNCPLNANLDQTDTDDDGKGDVCDSEFIVTVTSDVSHGTISPSDNQVVESGEQLTFSVMPEDGYKVNISGCGGELELDTYTTADITENCTVSISFTPWMIGERYQVFNNGDIIRDIVNNLEWMRCPVGQSWDADNETCIGTINNAKYSASYNAASQFRGPAGFRLPVLEELNTLVYCSSGSPEEYKSRETVQGCDGEFLEPTIDAEAFPLTLPEVVPGVTLGYFWTKTIVNNDPSRFNVVDFSNGVITTLLHASDKAYTRLVREVGEKEYSNAQGFPVDFPLIMDKGGLGKGTFITGRGGERDGSMTREQQQAYVANSGLRPVIFIHGNGGNAFKEYQDWEIVADELIDAGYGGAHLWSFSYLGMGNTSTQRGEHTYALNTTEVREFIDAVMEYLDVDKVDLVGHSLGAGMVRGYINGWTADAAFDDNLGRSDSVGTAILLAGLNRGGGAWYNGVFDLDDADFQIGSTFITGNAQREIGNGVNYYSAYSSYDKYEYYYKDEFWLDGQGYGGDPGQQFHYIASYLEDSSPAPASVASNFVGELTTGYSGDLEAAVESRNFVYDDFTQEMELYGASMDDFKLYDAYNHWIPTIVHMHMANDPVVIDWIIPFLNQ